MTKGLQSQALLLLAPAGASRAFTSLREVSLAATFGCGFGVTCCAT